MHRIALPRLACICVKSTKVGGKEKEPFRHTHHAYTMRSFILQKRALLLKRGKEREREKEKGRGKKELS